MSTLYVDNLQPNLGSRVSVSGHVIQVQPFSSTTATTYSHPTSDSYTLYHQFTMEGVHATSELAIQCIFIARKTASNLFRLATQIHINGTAVSFVSQDVNLRVYDTVAATGTDILTIPAVYHVPSSYLVDGENTISFYVADATGSATEFQVLYINGHVWEVGQ
mgnify:CR=1 FL=1